MKLHLPLSLLSAVLLVAAGLTSRAQAVEVPSNYTPHYLADPHDLYGYRTTSGNHAFLLDGSITFTPSSAIWWTSSQELKENGSILFTIEEDSDPYSLTFEGGANKAFYNVSTLAIEDIGRVTFEGLKESNYDYYDDSSYYYGGAINATTLRLKGNSRVTFTGNEVISNASSRDSRYYVYGGAIYGANGATITITETSGAVTFAQNKATGSSPSESYGGAIFGGDYSTISICDNEGDVSFTGNSSSSTFSYGGAIYGGSSSTISISSNTGDVNITENTASYSTTNYYTSYGGAIYGGSSSTISISGNAGSVNITGNSSAAKRYSYGGAIYGGSSSTISICDNGGDVNITGNSSTDYYYSYGGAIYGGSSSTISICDNGGDVNITGNSSSFAASSAAFSYGGAIYGGRSSTISISGNAGVVNITGNSSSATSSRDSCGGAIYGAENSTISICDNGGDVSFTGNSSSSASSAASYGGAIYGGRTSTISISGNAGAVNITGNSSSSRDSCGGAIYGGYNSTISICDNEGDVSFTGNFSSSSSAAASTTYDYGGGAIYGAEDSTISICDNEGDVSFTGNSSSASAASHSRGGAIYTDGNLSIRNNDSVLFEKNTEITNGTYRLRSIYASNHRGIISLSAAEGKSIEFRDSVYISSGPIVELNADYTNSEGNVIKQEGDIIFTGAYTETHLNELLTAAEAGRTATAEEIANSRTSEMHGKVTLYGGTLRVEEQAVLKTTAGLEVAAGSNATVKVSNAVLDVGNIKVGDSGTLTLMNGAAVKAANINIADGASFEGRTSSSQEAVATFSLREAASVAEPPQSCLVGANLMFEAGSTLVADGVYFSMGERFALTFKALTEGDKINLVLTLGAEYSDNDQVVLFSNVDVVRFIIDDMRLNSTDTIMANTFFTGAWVNDKTTLSYDSSSGTISLQHLNTVTVPEPTTATLSLLALAGLAARRRRRK